MRRSRGSFFYESCDARGARPHPCHARLDMDFASMWARASAAASEVATAAQEQASKAAAAAQEQAEALQRTEAFAQVSAVGHQAFGFALGMRDGHRKTLSFSLLREDTPAPTTKNGKADPNAKKAPMKINCPCTACGHLTTAIIDDDKINRGAEGEKNQVSVRFKCESCGADLAVKVTKRDPKLSI